MQRSHSSSLRPRTAPVDRAESLLTLTSTQPTIISPAATRNTAKGPGARLHGHQSYFGAHRQPKPLAATIRRAREPPQQVTPVENEYIQLLQQQIFFLELKLNIMKKNDPFQGVPLEGPLEDVVAQLRGKYATMESAFKKELEELKAKNDHLETVNVKQSRQIEHGSKAYEEQTDKMLSLEESSDAAAAEHLEAKLLYDSERQRLLQRLEQREKEADEAAERLTQWRAEQTFRYEKLKAEADEKEKAKRNAERKLEEAERRLKELEALNLEIREDGKRDRGDGDVNVGALATLKADKLRLEQALRRAQMAAEQAEATVKKTNDICDKLLSENTQLRTDMQILESKLEVSTRRQSSDSRSAAHWSTQIVELKKRVEDLTARTAEHPRELQTKQTEVDAIRSELAHAQSRIDDLQARRDGERNEYKRTRDDERRTEEANVILRKEALLRQKELDTVTAKMSVLQEDYDRTKEERDSNNDSLRVLQGRLDILKALGAIHIEDFQGMAQTNIRVAGAIENLASSIRVAPHPPGPASSPTSGERERKTS